MSENNDDNKKTFFITGKGPANADDILKYKLITIFNSTPFNLTATRKKILSEAFESLGDDYTTIELLDFIEQYINDIDENPLMYHQKYYKNYYAQNKNHMLDLQLQKCNCEICGRSVARMNLKKHKASRNCKVNHKTSNLLNLELDDKENKV